MPERKFALRPWRMEDAAALPALAGDLEVARWLRDVFPHPYTRSDAEDFLRLCCGADEDQALYRAVTVDGQVAGSMALTRGRDVYQKSAELGYWLGRPFWGRGLGTWAAEAICREGFRRWDIVRVYAGPYADNLASRRLLEKTGFRLEGVLRHSVWKLGELKDSCVYGLLREEWAERLSRGREEQDGEERDLCLK